MPSLKNERRRIVITIHGIRTYGHWQKRLRRILESDERWHKGPEQNEVLNYKYGLFDLLSFMIPFVRNLAVKRFRNYLETVFEDQDCSRVDIVAHSFGTYVAMEALATPDLPNSVRIDTAIFCGSAILPHRNLSRILGSGRRIRRIVNECGISDGVLLLTLPVPGVGMAGRFGLQGLEGPALYNRYHRVGHSGYFERRHVRAYDGFMKRWWLPLLLTDEPVVRRDSRPEKPIFLDRFWHVLSDNGATVALSIYAAFLTALAATFGYLWLDAVDARRRAIQEAFLAQKSRALMVAGLSVRETEAGRAERGLLLALAADPGRVDSDNHDRIRRDDVPALKAAAERALYSGVPLRLPEKGGENSIASVSFDGRRVASRSNDATILRISDTETGEAVHVPTGHRGPIRISFSPDGRRILTTAINITDEDTTARVWDAVTGDLLKELRHEEPVSQATFSADGRRIVTAAGKTARLRDTETGNELCSPLTGHEGAINRLSFSADNHRIATASGTTVRLWDVETCELLRPPIATGHWPYIIDVALSADGRQIVTTGDTTARLWSAETGVHQVIANHRMDVYRASFSASSQSIVIAGPGAARLLDMKTGEEFEFTGNQQLGLQDLVIASFSSDGKRVVFADEQMLEIMETESDHQRHILTGHKDKITDASFSKDGLRLVTVARNSMIRVWDTVTGRQLQALNGHHNVDRAWFSADDRRIVALSRDAVQVWDAETGYVVQHANDLGPKRPSFSSDLRFFVTVGRGSKQRHPELYDGKTGKLLRVLAGHRNGAELASFSPDGRRVITASWWDSIVRIWSTEVEGEPLLLHSGGVNSASFSFDGRRVLLGTRARTAQIFDTETGNRLHTLPGHEAAVTAVSFSEDGRRVVTVAGGLARIWDAETGDQLNILASPESITHASFSNDGRRVVTMQLNALTQTAQIWDALSGKPLHDLAGHNRSINSVAFSPDSKQIVTTSRDTTARLWDTNTGKEVRVLIGHTDSVVSASFTADGRRIVTGSDDKTARLWDVDTGKEVLVLIGHNDPVESTSYSTDGRRIATISKARFGHYAIRVWAVLAVPEIWDVAHQRKLRELSESERREFNLNE
jgi:WD40 repeat protein/pimeloyl-ACP methyl ester carboxylesterase